MGNEPLPSAYGTQTIQRAVYLLRLLTSHNRRGLRLVDLTAMTEMERPTVHRILEALITEGLVVREGATKKYHLGPVLYEMSLAASPRYQLRDLCQAHLQAVAESTGDTVFLIVRSGFDSVCIDRKDGGFPVRVSTRDVGQHLPLGLGAGGLAILAALPDETMEGVLAVNIERQAYSRAAITVKELRRRIRLTREMGYVAKTVDGAPGVRAIALAIPGSESGALSVSALSPRLSGPRGDKVLATMRRAVWNIATMVRNSCIDGRAVPLITMPRREMPLGDE